MPNFCSGLYWCSVGREHCEGCQLSYQCWTGQGVGGGERHGIFKIEMVILMRAASECVKRLHDLNIPRGFMLMQHMYGR